MPEPAVFPVRTAREAAADEGAAGRQPYGVLFTRGTLELGFYSPVGVDDQQPHGQDELYVVVSGNGWFERAGDRFPCLEGDALFVAAGTDHRFVDFSDDFAVWVVFYGPPGGVAVEPAGEDRSR